MSIMNANLILYDFKAKRKLLKHRYAEYSSKIGSIHKLAQSVLCFGDEVRSHP